MIYKIICSFCLLLYVSVNFASPMCVCARGDYALVLLDGSYYAIGTKDNIDDEVYLAKFLVFSASKNVLVVQAIYIDGSGLTQQQQVQVVFLIREGLLQYNRDALGIYVMNNYVFDAEIFGWLGFDEFNSGSILAGEDEYYRYMRPRLAL